MRPTRTDTPGKAQGFTIVELVLVLAIAGILIGFAAPQLQRAMHTRDVRGARDGVALLAARARAQAMELGRTAEFHFNRDAGRASILVDGDTVGVFDFGEELGVTATSRLNEVRLCYSPRGFATDPCSTVIGSDELIVRFSRAGHDASLEIWELGQVRKL